MRWVVVAGVLVAAVVFGIGLLAAEVPVVRPLDPDLVASAARAGGTIDQSVPGTAECWAAGPLPPSDRVGPLARCASVVSPAQALAVLRYTGDRALEMGLADVSWAYACPTRGCVPGPFLRRRLAWVIEVDRFDGIGGSYIGVGACGSEDTKLVIVDAGSGSAVLRAEWGSRLGRPPDGVPC